MYGKKRKKSLSYKGDEMSQKEEQKKNSQPSSILLQPLQRITQGHTPLLSISAWRFNINKLLLSVHVKTNKQ